MSRIPCSIPSTIDSISESLTLKRRDLELRHIENMQQLFKSGMGGMATEYLIASQVFTCRKSPGILLVCRFYLRRWGKGLWNPLKSFCQAMGHTWVALAVHWNHLGSFSNYWCSGPTFGETDFNWSGCSLGRSLKILREVSEWVKVAQSCLTLCDPMDYTVHLQARVLECVAFPFSRGSSQPRDWTQVSHTAGRFFTSWAIGKPKNTGVGSLSFLQKIFLTQELNQALLHCRQIL